MTKEEKLKSYILSQYKSIRQFSIDSGIPYMTIDNMIKRGIENSSASNLFRVCAALKISADRLVSGEIAPAESTPRKDPAPVELAQVIRHLHTEINDFDLYRVGGDPVTEEDAQILNMALDTAYEMIKKRHKK